MHATVEGRSCVDVGLKQGKMAENQVMNGGGIRGGWDWEGKLGWCICLCHNLDNNHVCCHLSMLCMLVL